MSDLVPRPGPPRSVRELARAWIEWFGIIRLVATAVAVVVVVGGGWLLVRTPPPAAEATLPVTSGSAPSSTLAVPTTVVATDAAFVVHVAGAVVAPGVYDVRGPARVVDAIDAAGGPTPQAELDSLNLAAPLVDGQRVYVPVVGEIVVPVADVPSAEGDPVREPIDLNTATAVELDALPGVGPATAAAIVEHRDENGPFPSIDAVTDVRGIGPAKLDAFRDLVRV